MTNEMIKVFPVPPAISEISHDKPVVFLGSCFSENIAQKMTEAGFRNLSNPFGVIFHPVPLADFIIDCFGQPADERIFRREDVFLSLKASGSIYGMSEEELDARISTARETFRNGIRKASAIFVTFGSAHGYRFCDDGKIAANCHKLPADRFTKELTEVAAMLERWQNALDVLLNENPSLQVIFTVSPVRYKRDGWIENNRSKARLIELCGELTKSGTAHYFPAYEIVNDLLRDYRFFAPDGVHPNELAIDEVWQLFRFWYFSDETKTLVSQLLKLRHMENHRLLHPESAASKSFKEKAQRDKAAFLAANPQIAW